MIEVYKDLFVGNQEDYESNVRMQEGWAVVHACKEPYHRQAVGYSGRACAKNHPEYLLALRGDRLILNLVDVDNPDWISPIIIDEAISFIDEQIKAGKKVLVHCNQGRSRSAGIALLYCGKKGVFTGKDFVMAEDFFKKKYQPYNPASGIREYCIKNWEKYCA